MSDRTVVCVCVCVCLREGRRKGREEGEEEREEKREIELKALHITTKKKNRRNSSASVLSGIQKIH